MLLHWNVLIDNALSEGVTLYLFVLIYNAFSEAGGGGVMPLYWYVLSQLMYYPMAIMTFFKICLIANVFSEGSNDIAFANYSDQWKLHRKIVSKAFRYSIVGICYTLCKWSSHYLAN